MQPITIIIPTIAGREASLAQVIAGLEAQTAGTGAFQVIVIQDGPGIPPPAPSALSPWLRVLSHERNRGLSAARNTALAGVETELAMFIDDDIIPSPGVIEAHLAFHRRHHDPMVMGAGRVTWQGHPRYNGLMDWYENRGDWSLFHTLLPDQCFPYWVGGFTSFRTETLRALGFSEAFTRYGCEDHELGYRFFRQGGRLRFVDQAAGLHLKEADAASLYREQRQGMWSKWLLLDDYPDLVGSPTGLVTAVQMERQAADPAPMLAMLDRFSTGARNRMAISTDLMVRFLAGMASCHGMLDAWRDRFPGFDAAAEHLYRGQVTGETDLPTALAAALAACPEMPWIRLHASRLAPDLTSRKLMLEAILAAFPSYSLVFLERLELLTDAREAADAAEAFFADQAPRMERGTGQACALRTARILLRHGLQEPALALLRRAAQFECWSEDQLICARQAEHLLGRIHQDRGEPALALQCQERQLRMPAGSVREVAARLALAEPREAQLRGHGLKWLELMGEGS